jgi:L-fucose isomerase-like protein
MKKAHVGFVVYGVHKDGLRDPLGVPFIDADIVNKAKKALRDAGLDLVLHPIVIASKQEAIECLNRFKKMDDLDAVVLFSGTWVWAAHLAGALRDFSFSGKSIVLWTHPGSQGWRPVGGLVMHGALKEIGIQHQFVYAEYNDCDGIERIVSWCRAGQMINRLNLSTLGVFGGRGMGQTCGVADPSQWMHTFGIDIDSRDTHDLVCTANGVTQAEVSRTRKKIQPLFSDPIPDGDIADRSIRLYIALKKILKKENWDFYAIQSFPGLGDYYGASCFAQSMMLNDGVATGTLSDFNTTLTVKLLTDLSSEPVYYGDLQHIDTLTNEIKIIGDGACPPSLAGERGPARFAEHGIPTEGEAGGLSIELVCKPGDGVLARLGRNNGDFELIVTHCTVFEPSEKEIQRRRNECCIPFWPHAFVTAHCDIEALIECWNNEYACLGYGSHLYEELVAFGEQTDMTVLAL